MNAAPRPSGDDGVDDAEEAEDERQQRQERQQERVEEDLAARLDLAVDDRHHRDADPRVLVLHQQRERPEVRRRPVEDDREQVQRGGREQPVAAAQPTSGGTAPAAPPMTMFCGERRLSQIV